MEDFRHIHFGRNRKTLTILICIYAVLVFLTVQFDAAPWIMGTIAAFTLPALWDLYTNRSAGITLSDHQLTWHSGQRGCEINIADINKVRLDTRLDLSVKATIIPHEGRKIRLPYEATPPHKQLEFELNARHIKTERHHFSLLS